MKVIKKFYVKLFLGPTKPEGYSSDSSDLTEKSTSQNFSATINRSDLEQTGYILPETIELSESECAESIESSPSAYKYDEKWNGYRVKKRRKKSKLVLSSDENSSEDESKHRKSKDQLSL